MEGVNCPLCCNKTFPSKQLLLDHLMTIFYNLTCSICNCKLSSLSELIDHLNLNNCEAQHTGRAIVYVQNNTLQAKSEITIEHSNPNLQESPIENENDISIEQFTTEQNVDDNVEINKMYVELLNKPCLQNQELKFIRKSGDNGYMILTQEDSEFSTDTKVVSKQNSDGTVSFISEKELKLEDNLSGESEDSNETQNQIPTYSCNTCGVTFTSVLEHIQNYHNDQDVVVEEPIDDAISERIPVYDPLEENEADKHGSRRVITESGDIVETSVIVKPDIEEQNGTIVQTCLNIDNTDAPETIHLKQEVVTQNSTVPVNNQIARKYVKVDKLCESFVKNIKKGKKPYHKVVVKEMQTLDGDKMKVKIYNCLSCNVYVTDLDDFKQHPCKTQYPCPRCTVVYDNSQSLCAHMKVHKGNTVESHGTYRCNICSTIFPTNKSLKLHKRMHEPIKPRPIEPPVSLMNGEEASKDKFLCAICDKLIPIDYRGVHQNFHKNNNTLNCVICNRKFTSVEYLEMHMKVHNVEKAPVNNQDKTLPYNCLYCNRQFARPHEKVKHERIHTGEKPHSCAICGKSFRVSYCLTLHMRTHTGARPYACPTCGKRFKAHSVYNHHLQTHSDVRAYKCPYCPKAFKTSVQLAGHKNSHTKPFSCQHCNRPFASLYAVRVHTETHLRQNNLKFSCQLCGASYARTFALKDHMKQVHDKEVDTETIIAQQTNLKENWVSPDNTNSDDYKIENVNESEMNDLEPITETRTEIIIP